MPLFVSLKMGVGFLFKMKFLPHVHVNACGPGPLVHFHGAGEFIWQILELQNKTAKT